MPNPKSQKAKAAAHDKATAARDLEMLEARQRERVKPHVHKYVDGLCTTCKQTEIEST